MKKHERKRRRQRQRGSDQCFRFEAGDFAMLKDGGMAKILGWRGDHAICLINPNPQRSNVYAANNTEFGSVNKDHLILANQESIRLGFDRTLKKLHSLPPANFPIINMLEHKNASGSKTVRLTLLLCPKRPDDPTLTDGDVKLASLDVTRDTFQCLRENILPPS